MYVGYLSNIIENTGFLFYLDSMYERYFKLEGKKKEREKRINIKNM